MERLDSYRYSNIISRFFIVLLLLITGCGSQRPVTPSDSYSIPQFIKLSHRYKKTVYTRSSGRIYASQIRFKGDSVYVDGEKSAVFQSHWTFAMSGIQKIKLQRRGNWKFLGFLAGATTGVILAGLIYKATPQNAYFPWIGGYFVIPPITSILGLVIGHGFDQPRIYQGDYRIVPDSGTYRLKHIKQKKRQPAQTSPAFE
ncbi:MAG TPA: hypothetical protein VKA08_02155 [Balneolales bacterium]|nr:hypothetical protein [Balneolales bacterium]